MRHREWDTSLAFDNRKRFYRTRNRIRRQMSKRVVSVTTWRLGFSSLFGYLAELYDNYSLVLYFADKNLVINYCVKEREREYRKYKAFGG